MSKPKYNQHVEEIAIDPIFPSGSATAGIEFEKYVLIAL